MKIEQAIVPAITFFLGALFLYIVTPTEPKPVAELVIWTTTQKIIIPLNSTATKPFTDAGTNFLVIQGISVNSLPK